MLKAGFVFEEKQLREWGLEIARWGETKKFTVHEFYVVLSWFQNELKGMIGAHDIEVIRLDETNVELKNRNGEAH